MYFFSFAKKQQQGVRSSLLLKRFPRIQNEALHTNSTGPAPDMDAT